MRTTALNVDSAKIVWLGAAAVASALMALVMLALFAAPPVASYQVPATPLFGQSTELIPPNRVRAQSNNSSPVITMPAYRTYWQGETIAAFPIAVTDADNDPVTVTVTGYRFALRAILRRRD
ncbi:MAG: hypothetical protein OXR67_17630 [Chloroflexota bacterium]|nr:hypothetical protein [Chloroflexota bacterium]